MNELQQIYIQKITIRKAQPEPDKRYRIMVTLIRSDRPRVWVFKCMSCGSKVCEIVNCEVYDVADFYDPENPSSAGTMKHCKGLQPQMTNVPCPYSYFFNMA